MHEAAALVAAEQRRAASGRAAGGGLPYRPDEDVPLHELRGGVARASRVRREAGPGGLARGGSEQHAARGRKEQGGTRMVWARRRPVARPGYSHAVTASCRRLRRVPIPVLLLFWY